MLHTCYHIISDHNNNYVRTLEDVQTKIAELETKGENHIKLSEIFTEEDYDVDAIKLKEVQITVPREPFQKSTSISENLIDFS